MTTRRRFLRLLGLGVLGAGVAARLPAAKALDPTPLKAPVEHCLSPRAVWIELPDGWRNVTFGTYDSSKLTGAEVNFAFQKHVDDHHRHLLAHNQFFIRNCKVTS